jgi:hypothetical protein
LKKLENQKEAPIANPEGIIRFYAAMLETIMSETAAVGVGLTPSADACHATLTMRAIPGTKLASTMAPIPHADAYRKVLGYLQDDAVINLATAVDAQGLEKTYLLFIDLMPKMMGEDVSQADLVELRELIHKSFGALGDSLAFSFVTGGEGPGLFAMHYVFEVKDKAAIEDAIAEGLQLTNSELYQKFLGGFGLDAHAETDVDASVYKGVSINAARVTFKGGDDDSPQARMVQAMYGGGLDYRWAVTDGYCIYTIGKEADKRMRELIDQIKADGAKNVCSEMKAALQAIEDSDKADTVGTFNYVRMLNSMMGVMPLPDGKTLPKLDVPTEGNIAFAAFTGTGMFRTEVVLPKKHVLEIKSAFETLGREMKDVKKQESPSGM